MEHSDSGWIYWTAVYKEAAVGTGREGRPWQELEVLYVPADVENRPFDGRRLR